MIVQLLLLFVAVPLIELALLLVLADLTRWEYTLLLVIASGVIGVWLVRRQGLRTWFRIQDDLAAGRVPTGALVDGVMILVAGALLLTPGILTDAFGLSLLLPPCRRLYQKWFGWWFRSRVKMHYHFSARGQEPEQESPDDESQVIDSYVVRRRPDDS